MVVDSRFCMARAVSWYQCHCVFLIDRGYLYGNNVDISGLGSSQKF